VIDCLRGTLEQGHKIMDQMCFNRKGYRHDETVLNRSKNGAATIHSRKHPDSLVGTISESFERRSNMGASQWTFPTPDTDGSAFLDNSAAAFVEQEKLMSECNACKKGRRHGIKSFVRAIRRFFCGKRNQHETQRRRFTLPIFT
jgi:hypothetical protein